MFLIKLTPRTRKIISDMPCNSTGYSTTSAVLHLSDWLDSTRFDISFDSLDEIDFLITRLQELKSASFTNCKG